jgi:hypothetical protein
VRETGTGCDAIFLNGPEVRRNALWAAIVVTPASG